MLYVTLSCKEKVGIYFMYQIGLLERPSIGEYCTSLWCLVFYTQNSYFYVQWMEKISKWNMLWGELHLKPTWTLSICNVFNFVIPKLYMTLFQCFGDIKIQYCSIKRRTPMFGNVHVRIELLRGDNCMLLAHRP